MKKYIGIATVVIVLAIALAAITIQGKPDSNSKEISDNGFHGNCAPLPKALDTLYPPIAASPIWLADMIKQGQLFTTIAVDISENNFSNAKTDFKLFKSEYVNNSKLIPEWKDGFKMQPLTSLESAINSGDPVKAMNAYGKVGQVCEDCHVVNMPKVQQKYHWLTSTGERFTDINVTTGTGNVSFTQIMQGLDFGITAIGVDSIRNNQTQAQADFQEFNATFQLLKVTCNNCHTTPRLYYVDSSVQGMVDSLGANISPPNITAIGDLSQAIGMESCFKCHLVHVSGAFAQEIGAKEER